MIGRESRAAIMAIGRGGTISMMILSGTRKPTIILLLIVTAIVMGVSIMIMLVPVIRMWRIHWPMMVVMVRVWGRFLCAIFHVVIGQLLVIIIVFGLVVLRAGLPWG